MATTTPTPLAAAPTASATPAPAAPATGATAARVATSAPAPVATSAHRRRLDAKAIGTAIIAVLIIFGFGLGNIQKILGNLGSRGVEVTNPTRSWGQMIPSINMDTVVGFALIVALVLYYWPRKQH